VKALVEWVLARRTRLVLLAVVTAPLLSVVSAALIALETARRGTLAGGVAGAGVVAGLALLAGASRADMGVLLAVGLVCAVGGLAAGGLIKRAGNFVLAFQAAMLLCLGLVVLMSVLRVDARLFLEPTLRELVALLPAGTPADEVELVKQRTAGLLLGTLVFLQVVGSVLLGYWWMTVAAGQRRFGHEFRQLRLGRVLGTVATALIASGLVFDVQLVQNLTPLALLGFLLQGIAVLHAWAHWKRWPPGLMAPLYLLLLMPGLNVAIVLPISMVGLVDQWFDLRAKLRPQT
jgi:hypothetical protein